MTYNSKKNGFVTLTSVLIIGAVCLAIAVSILYSSIDSNKSGYVSLLSSQARGIAQACAETALSKLKQDSKYAGGETLTIDTGSCAISSVSGSGASNRTFTASGTVKGVTRKLSVSVATVSPQMTLSSWQEVP